jgi:NTP pyrophosphatase (non-canonical NTP hydrolase)
LDELNQLAGRLDPDTDDKIMRYINDRRDILNIKLEASAEDLFRSVVRSHEAVCAAKQMDERAAYGQDPAMYYTLAICGEAGEMGNKIVKALRNGNDPKAAKNAIMSELPDIFIYGAVLAYVLDIDLTRLVNEKVQIVIERADSGYYGGPLPKA